MGKQAGLWTQHGQYRSVFRPVRGQYPRRGHVAACEDISGCHTLGQRGLQLASSGEKPETLLHKPQCTGQTETTQQNTIQPKASTEQKLRNPDLESVCRPPLVFFVSGLASISDRSAKNLIINYKTFQNSFYGGKVISSYRI